MVIQQYLSSLIGKEEFDADTAQGQVCACKTKFCNNLHFTKTVISDTERQISQAELHTAPSERNTSQGEWHSSYYIKAVKSVVTDSAINITSRRKSTTLHLKLPDVTTMETLSTPSFATRLAKSNQMLISTLSVLYLACVKLLV